MLPYIICADENYNYKHLSWVEYGRGGTSTCLVCCCCRLLLVWPWPKCIVVAATVLYVLLMLLFCGYIFDKCVLDELGRDDLM